MRAVAILRISVFLVMLIATADLVLADTKDAQKTFLSYCNICHSSNWALQAVKNEENWRLTIERMSFQYKMFGGREIPPTDQDIILEYLLQEAGKN